MSKFFCLNILIETLETQGAKIFYPAEYIIFVQNTDASTAMMEAVKHLVKTGIDFEQIEIYWSFYIDSIREEVKKAPRHSYLSQIEAYEKIFSSGINLKDLTNVDEDFYSNLINMFIKFNAFVFTEINIGEVKMLRK